MPKSVKQILRPTDLLVFLLIIIVVAAAAWRLPGWRLEIGMVGGFVLFALLVWKVLILYLDANLYSEKKDLVDLHAKILGSAAIVAGLLFTWQSIKLNQATSENTLSLSLRTLQNNERSQLEDRFNRALEQLGSDKREARLGAIYSLGKIAVDSIEMKTRFDAMNNANSSSGTDAIMAPDYHWSIMQTLSAYVRGNAIKAKNTTRQSAPIPPDIQAAMDVLAWRTRTYLKGESQRLELYGTNLRGLVLKDQESSEQGSTRREGAHLEGAQLYEADLEKANLRGIRLEGAILKDANLKNAYLYGAYLQDVDLTGADLEGADLGKASGLKAFQLIKAKNWDKALGLPDDMKKALEDYGKN